jgi:periplasmic protein TonB
MTSFRLLCSILFLTAFTGLSAQSIESPPVPPPVEEHLQEDQIFTIVEQMPSYGNGDQSEIIKFISENVVYPPSAMENKIEGVVYIRFIVEKDGSLSDYKILRDVSGTDELSREAIRVIKLTSGSWKPGMQSGKPVRVYYNLPVRFKLQ